VLTGKIKGCIFCVDVSNDANAKRTEDKMVTPQIESTIEIPTIETLNITATHTKEYAIEMAKINNEEDDWTYVAEPKNADDPNSRWIIKIYDEDNFFVGTI
jgi:hypothetical protein